MKEFIGTLFACIVICCVFTFFFLGIIVENIWTLVILIAFVLAVLITILIRQETRIEELENKMEELLSNK
ncbi:hypothetical protein H8S33_18770 [Ornithinibacillus sp. BX22]|uniref:Uncharacterized protein n=2 Tax=Ornithinibacillus TaxID=484508 RepID=A0A923L990_9BACI|nr:MULTISPECIES: hypothetical protein [Ornithinibacillus]MBC5638818.1 hypothetical protein [Ornithinibacillus hominis]MBS3679811.1 hypothetical protein [Ornithinibacillus massiliensis]